MLKLTQKNTRFLILHSAFLVFGIAGFFNVKAALFLLVAIVFLFVVKSRPWLPLALFIIVIPLSNVPFLDARLGNVPGLELLNILLICAILMCMASGESFKLSRSEIQIISFVFLIHATSFSRSVPHLSDINWYNETNMNIIKYTISHFFKPIFFFLPFLLIIGYVRKRERVHFFYRIIVLSLFISSIYIIYVYIFQVPDKAGWSHVRSSIGDFLGFHSNEMAILFVVAYPFVLINYIHRRNIYSAFCLFLTLASVALLYSRTAYVLIIFSSVILFLVEKRKKSLLLFCGGMILFLLFSAETVKERITVGLENQDMATISAGRLDQIWPAVFQTLSKDPLAIVFGKGRHSIIYAVPLEKGHSHNMYLEATLDSGIIGLFGFLVIFFYVMKQIREGIADTEDTEMKLILKASLVSIIAFMISGFSGRHFFPDITNSYLWIVMGLGLTTLKVNQAEHSSDQ